MVEGLIKRRDAVIAIAAGALIAVTLNAWYRNVASAEMVDGYRWLARIHEPAASLAERLFYTLYPRIGNPWSLRWAVACGYLILISTWVVVAFGLLKLARLIPRLDARFTKLMLLSLVIASAGYL